MMPAMAVEALDLDLALRSLTRVERHLWGWSVRRGIERPGARLARLIPKYGVIAATHSVVGNLWLLPGLAGFFLSLPLLEIRHGSEVMRGFGWFLVGCMVASLACAVTRIVTASRAGRSYRSSRT
jgi:hypothetical protein